MDGTLAASCRHLRTRPAASIVYVSRCLHALSLMNSEDAEKNSSSQKKKKRKPKAEEAPADLGFEIVKAPTAKGHKRKRDG